MNYSELVTNLSTLLVVPSTNADFVAILPALINDAEQRIYRELDFLYTRESDSSVTMTAGNREVSAPSTFIVIEGLSAITPAGSAPAAGTRVPLERVSLDFIDTIWPTAGTTDEPIYFAMKTDSTAVIAPTPDGNYVCEFTGTFRPDPMSATNTTTWLGDHLPDLFLAACMIFGAAYLRDYGQMSDDPKLAMSWENHYQLHKQSAIDEEQRRKSQGQNWTPYSKAVESTPRT